MSPDWQIDDDTIEAIVRGEASCEGWLSPVVSFARQVQEIGNRARPTPSADLLALFDGSDAVESPSGLDRSVELASVAAPVAGPLAAAEQARHSLGDGPGEPARGSGLAEGITLDLLGDEVEGAVPSTLDDDEGLGRSPRRSLLDTTTAVVHYLRSMPRTVVATAAAVVFVVVAGITGVAPQPVAAFVQSTVSSVTPFDLTDDSDDPEVDVRTEPEPRDSDKSPVETDDTRAEDDTGEPPAEDTPEQDPELDLPDDFDRSGAEEDSTSEQPAPEPEGSPPPPTAAPETSDGSDTSGTGFEIPENPWWPPPESDDGGWADSWTDGWPAP